MPLCFLLFVLAQVRPAAQPAPALHLVAESRFTYMASTQTTTSEQWLAESMTYETRGARVIITRQDRGVRWVIDTQKRTYSETTLAPGSDAAKPETANESIHTAGFSYEPVFAWTVTQTAETATVNGRTCRLTTADGVADFAGISMKLWLCPAQEKELERKANGRILEMARFRYQDPVTFATSLLAKQSDVSLLSLEATVDPPIAPRMLHQVRFLTFEKGQPPPGIFDLPGDLQKTSK